MAYTNYLLCVFLVSISAQLMDEMQVYEQQCLGEDRFQCADGGCVAQEQLCDGNRDCPDGSDEAFCLQRNLTKVVCDETHQFLCDDGSRCLPTTWMCNNISECDDGSDELNCTEPNFVAENATCKGFTCDVNSNKKCISKAWVCDAVYDCEDQSDEDPHNCHHSIANHYHNHEACELRVLSMYLCADKSFCLPKSMMCDGLPDCRDHSDEGDYCQNWKTMCTNFTCGVNSTCRETRDGPVCECYNNYFTYNSNKSVCEPINMCEDPTPYCSQTCLNGHGWFHCRCEFGYISDKNGIQDSCHAPEPEGLLFFTTMNEIRYLKVKSKQIVTVATGIKQGHGVSYDGTFIYWVETAKGHQSIVRARLDNVQGTKEVLVAIGLEDAGDVAVDWLGGHIYFSDSERGIIAVCTTRGDMCTELPDTGAVHPKFVTLDPRNGMMYWADYRNHRSMIMMARMDGSQAEVLLDNLTNFPTGLAVDPPSGRLYYVDKIIVGLLISNRKTYSVFDETIHHPYAIAVFENTVYFSDWTSDTIQRVNKMRTRADNLSRFYKLDEPVYGMHIYHPILMGHGSNPCDVMDCSHLCLLTSNTTGVCACPQGYILSDNTTCKPDPNYQPQYLVIAAGSQFTRIQINALGNPELAATTSDMGRVNALTYDPKRDALYIYDGFLKTLNSLFMSSFQTGVTHTLLSFGFEEVVDIDFDPVSDTVYILDVGRGYLEVFSVITYKRSVLKRFTEETLISLCVLSNYGKVLIALRRNSDDRVEIREYGLDGEAGSTIVFNNLKGPRILMKYSESQDSVYISDDGNRIIDYIHPKGSGRETYVELSTSVMGLAVTPMYVFWTDRRNTRLYWSVLHEAMPKIRRLEFSIFPNNTHLHIQSAIPNPSSTVPTTHPCHTHTCTGVCVQSSSEAGYKCLCAPGTMNMNGVCEEFVQCRSDQEFCPQSNTCYSISGRCDGKQDCPHNEDEEGCPTEKPTLPSIMPKPKFCSFDQKLCYGECINKKVDCITSTPASETKEFKCDNATEFECLSHKICISRSQVCNKFHDCPDNSDEAEVVCSSHTCLPTEFRCQSGNCIMNIFRCDGEPDCTDGSDEVGCVTTKCAAGYFTCKSGQCVESNRRCDTNVDCADESDELECEDPDDYVEVQETAENCQEWEHACELNRTICLPHSARCNQKVECPGGTDEAGCKDICHTGWFCFWHFGCLDERKVCDGLRHCPDGSDETPEACAKVNRTSNFYPSFYPMEECNDGYLCKNGQCVQWSQVCDTRHDCLDGSDEGGNCSMPCLNQCEDSCRPSPSGPVCSCALGLRVAGTRCEDVNECQETAVCAQGCYNVYGSYLCTCDKGYVLRPDRHSCKALKGHMSLYYATGNSVQTKASGYVSVAYTTDSIINDIDIDIRNNKLYLSTHEKLIEVSPSKQETVITNIGNPEKVSLDWPRGNVYFSDQTRSSPSLRICNFRYKRCAKLLKLPTNSTIPALAVDPSNHIIFYCVTTETDSVVWSASLSGQDPVDLASVEKCSGLAVDSYRKKLYVAEYSPSRILQMDYDGDRKKEMHANDPHLKSPQDLAIFEDYIYYLVPESDQLRRCLLYGNKQCEVYQVKALHAQTFVLHHENLQRNDVWDRCTKVLCENICVNSKDGPVCVCEDGFVTKNGSCPLIEKAFLPRFNNEIQQAHFEQSYTDAVLACLMALLALSLISLVTYSVYRKRNRYGTRFTRVQFSWRHQRGSACSLGEEGATFPITRAAQVSAFEPPASGSTSVPEHEYINPLERFSFIKHLRRSFIKRPRPVGTAGLTIDIPRSEDYMDIRGTSDTESDLDDRDSGMTFSYLANKDERAKRNSSDS